MKFTTHIISEYLPLEGPVGSGGLEVSGLGGVCRCVGGRKVTGWNIKWIHGI